MWTTETIFNRERFEAWLASQPGDREFDYMDHHGCVVCHFIKETTNAKSSGVGGKEFYLYPEFTKQHPLPMWIVQLLREARFGHGTILSIDRLRTCYQKLFAIDVCAEYPIEAPTQPIPDAV